jgi:TRAP-type C4-dicarboxylate transport system substrate-binding protein
MSRFIKTVVAATLTATAVGIAAAQEVTLRAGVFVPVNTAFGEMCGRFVNQLNAEAKGTVQIRLVGGPEAIPSFEQANAVRSGVLDMACLPPAFYVSIMPEADSQILATTSTIEQRKSGAYATLQAAHRQRMGAHLLASYGDGIRFHIFTNKPVAKVEDLKGMKLRTTPNYTPFFQALGVSLVNTAPGEVQQALERGVVEGYGWPLIGIFDLGWASFTRYRVDPGFYTVIVNVLINDRKWQSLSPAQRAALEKTATWFDQENLKWVADKVATESKRQADAGIRSVDLGADFRKGAYDAYWAEMTKRAPEQTRALRQVLDR